MGLIEEAPINTLYQQLADAQAIDAEIQVACALS
jgi:hypothetical protein